MNTARGRPWVRPETNTQGQSDGKRVAVTRHPSIALSADGGGDVKPRLQEGEAGPPAKFPHPKRICPHCVSLALADGRPSGVHVCGMQLWRVIRDPQRHLLHRKGDAICWQEGLWQQGKDMGAEFLIAYLADKVRTASRETFEEKCFRVLYPGHGAQVGLPLRFWSEHSRNGDAGVQIGLFGGSEGSDRPAA